MIRFYGMAYDDVLSMHLRRFWFMNRQIERIRAEEAVVQLCLIGSATSAEGYSSMMEHLERAMGVIAVYGPETNILEIDQARNSEMDPAFDIAAFNALKDKLNGRI